MSSNIQDIQDYLSQLEQEQEQLKIQITDICFFMKGGIEWNTAWDLCFKDRERIIERLNKWNKEMNGDGTEYM